jgi:MerR HTH family regulatory protein
MQLQSGGQVLTPSRRSFRRHTALIATRRNAAGGTSVEVERIAPERGQLPASRMPGSLSTGRLYMTGDLRALTGLPRTHMDFYLREGIIQPTTRTGSGYLLFDHAELETLRAVLRWREEGVGIREIRDRLGRPASH